MKERARSAVLGEDLPETVLARDVVVLRPIEIPLDLDGSHHELRVGERLLKGGGGADGDVAPELICQRLSIATDRRKTVGNDIHQTQLEMPF
jgi:hypothetical protein